MHVLATLFLWASFWTALEGRNACVVRRFGPGRSVCVCDARQCGALEDREDRQKPAPGTFAIYTTSRAGTRFRRDSGNFTTVGGRSLSEEDERIVWPTAAGGQFSVDAFTTYQTVHGFGGAITDSAAINIIGLSEGSRDNLMRALFGPEGNAYTLLRVPMGGNDDSTRKYTYADVPGRAGRSSLENFRLAEEDLEYKIPILQNASLLAGGPLRLMGSAWTAPPWMKSNNQFVSGVLKTEFYQDWAEYHIRFLDAYAGHGLPMWAITTGNEPINGFAPFIIRFNSMGWTPWSQRLWVGRHLGPALRASRHNATLLLALDDQRMLLPWWIELMMRDPEARQFVDGVAVHWYWDLVDPSIGLEATHDRFPDKFILSSEASSADKPWHTEKVRLGSWSRAEKYMDDMITDLSHWVTGWMEWSLVLDVRGGPSWSGNYVDVGVIADLEKDQVLLQPAYFAMGHFSRFVPPGSVRLRLERAPLYEPVGLDDEPRRPEAGGPGARRGRSQAEYVRAVAFRTPEDLVVVVMHNRGDSDERVAIRDPRVGVANVVLPARSFNTIIYTEEGTR